MVEHQHKPSSLKQVNKKFKARHSTKSELRDRNKGRVERHPTNKTSSSSLSLSKADRKNAAKIAQKYKRDVQSRLHGSIGQWGHGPPKIVALVPLSVDVDMDAVIDIFSLLPEVTISREASSGALPPRISVTSEKFKQHFQFVVARQRSLIDILDACQVADVVLFVTCPENDISETPNHPSKKKACALQLDTHAALCVSTLAAQGLPSHVACISQTPHPSPITPTLKNEYRHQLSLFFSPILSSLESSHLFVYPDLTEIEKIFRYLCTLSIKPVRWRDQHSYLVVDDIAKVNDHCFSIRGTVRGARLTAARALYMPGFGDLKILEIRQLTDKRKRRPLKGNDMNIQEEESEGIVLETSETHPKNDTRATLEVDMSHINEDEMTEDDEDELEEEEEEGMEEDAHSRDIDSDTFADQKTVSFTNGSLPTKRVTFQDAMLNVNGNNQETMGSEESDEGDDDAADDDDEASYQAYLASRKREAGHHHHKKEQYETACEFPDEVDTPRDTMAKDRFRKYRGLKDFRHSLWDASEGLPQEYTSISSLQNVPYARHFAVKQARTLGVAEGTQVQLLVSVDNTEGGLCSVSDFEEYIQSRSFLTAFQPLTFEENVTVLNGLLTRPTENSILSPCYSAKVIQSKDLAILQSGFRRFYVRPVYSEHASQTSASKFKMNSYFKMGDICVATVYGFVNLVRYAPLLLFHADERHVVPGADLLKVPVRQLSVASSMMESDTDGFMSPLIATGSLLNMQTQRVVLKRIVLTGVPFKIHTRSVVVQYMFFNAPDINWFSPVPLRTKYGRVGHIRESLGTKGHMKCVFDGPIKQHDTICMHLYKRVFPKRYQQA